MGAAAAVLATLVVEMDSAPSHSSIPLLLREF
jgi:hypothetical protein